MKRETYKEMAATAQGRKELHEIMLNEIKAKFDTLVNCEPEVNREEVRAIFENQSGTSVSTTIVRLMKTEI